MSRRTFCPGVERVESRLSLSSVAVNVPAPGRPPATQLELENTMISSVSQPRPHDPPGIIAILIGL